MAPPANTAVVPRDYSGHAKHLPTPALSRSVTDHIEIEFKLRSSFPLEVAVVDAALRELDVVVRGSESIQHEDSYLDDDRGSLRAAGIGLRLREREGRRELTCKARGAGAGGMFVRRELEVPWAAALPPHLAAELPAALRERIEPFVLDRPLRTFLRLVTARDVRRIGGGPTETCCELTVDRVRAETKERSVLFDEIELEVAGDAAATERLALALRERLPLRAADTDKPSHACDLLGLTQPAPSEVDAATPVGEAVRIVTARHLLALRHAEAGVRSDGGSEALHTMRVAVRRLRSLVRAFTDLWSEADGARLQAVLTMLGRRLGAVRDLDVLLGTLDAHLARLPKPLAPAGRELAGTFTEARAAANDDMLGWLRSDECRRQQTELESLLAANSCGCATARIGDELPPRLGRAALRMQKRLRTIAPELPPEPMHELRIASKRLRYLAEEFATVADAAMAKPLRRITALQMILGSVRDEDSLAERLLHELHRQPANDAPWRAAAIGAVVMRAGQAAAKTRKRARKALADTDKKRVWKAFAVPASEDAAPAPDDATAAGDRDRMPPS